MANKNFRKYFKIENELNPGYGFSRGMKSKEWWFNIVSQVIKDDLKAKNMPNIFDLNKLSCISNVIYDEFKKENYWQKYSDCDFILDKLKRIHKLKIGIISNFDERIYEILKNLNLITYFDFICIPSNCDGFAKPSEKIFLNALFKSGCKNSQELLHIGDNIDLDYLPAISLNFESVLLKHLSNENEKRDFLKKIPDHLNNQLNHAFNLKDLLSKIQN